jgi:hypothetical protein
MARRKRATDEQSVSTPTNADDNFGLPEIEYEPLDREEQPEPVANEASFSQESRIESTYRTPEPEEPQRVSASTYAPYIDEPEQNMFPKIAGIIIVLLLAAGATWYFAYYRPAKQAEKALIEQKQKEAERLEQEKLAAEQRAIEERRRAEELAAANATPKEGVIETLSERTKRYYVVVASSIDGDLIMDYAKKLSQQGVSSKIIPPYGKIKFSRLTLAEGDSYTDTQKLADSMKGEYGDALWVIKY